MTQYKDGDVIQVKLNARDAEELNAGLTTFLFKKEQIVEKECEHNYIALAMPNRFYPAICIKCNHALEKPQSPPTPSLLDEAEKMIASEDFYPVAVVRLLIRHLREKEE